MAKLNRTIQVALYFLSILATIHGAYASILDRKFYYHIFLVAGILVLLATSFGKDKTQNS